MKREFLEHVQQLKVNHDDLQRALDAAGMRVKGDYAGLAKMKLVTTVQDITRACEGLLRGDAAEGHVTRLSRSIPDALQHLERLSGSPLVAAHMGLLSSVKGNLTFIKQHYENI